MRKCYLILLIIVTYFGCKKIEIQIDENQLKIENDKGLPFYEISIDTLLKTAFLDTIKIKSKVDTSIGFQQILEVGILYSDSYELLYDETKTLDDLLQLTPTIKVQKSREEDISSFLYTTTIAFEVEELGKKIFFRAYAKYTYANDDFEEVTRKVLSKSNATIELSLSDGWYQKRNGNTIGKRQFAFNVQHPNQDYVIVGQGCDISGNCTSRWTPFPYLKIKKDEIIEEMINCPIDENIGILYNRSKASSFWIGDTVYFGLGLINSTLYNKDLYKYVPDNCSFIPSKIPMPPNFKGRSTAIAFSIGNYGYIGGGAAIDTVRTTPSVRRRRMIRNDFWRYDPTTGNLDSLELVDAFDEPVILGKYSMISFTSNKTFAVIGGGYDKDRTIHKTFWKFEPIESTNQVRITPLGQLPENVTGIVDGIGFEIDNELYTGLGNPGTKNNFFKYNGIDKWEPVTPFPFPQLSQSTGFTMNNKGYVITGINLENDQYLQKLCIYLPKIED